MHELSLAEELVEQLAEVARREGAERIVEIRLELGAMCGVDRDAFEFAFPAVAEGGLAERAALVIEEIPVSVRCGRCGSVSEPAYPMMRCAVCGCGEVVVVAGREFKVLSMEVC
jgi:hydrogenase nickel incorporation protein HypA/HybF